MNHPQSVQLHAIFKGKVQGVGFRWTVLEAAERFSLLGTVSNLKDGSVEVYAEGPKEHLSAFLETLKNDSGNAKFDEIELHYLPATNQFKMFEIR